jgi:uncharacterized protein YcfJ
MKKILLLAGILSVSSAHAINEDTVYNGLLGAVIGGVIGNNVGEGDSETGALIGGITGVIFGEKSRSHRVYDRRHRHGGCHERIRVYPTTKTIEIRERVWVPGRVIRNACGEVIYREQGRYETHSRFETITVYR